MAGTVTATASGGGSANGTGIDVRVLNNAASTQNGATAGSVTVTTPQQSITPNASGSWVYGALNQAGSGTFTPNGSTTFKLNASDTTDNDKLGTFRTTATTTGGTPVTAGATAPTSTAGLTAIALAEILAAGSMNEDASTPAAVNTTTKIASTASFSPPAGSLLVAIVSADYSGSGTVTMTITDTFGGLTWTPLIQEATAGYAGVWIARMPSGVTGTGSIAVPAPKFAASGSFGISGTGSVRVPSPAFAGSGAVAAGVTGTGSLRVPSPALAGSNLARPPLLISLASAAGTDDYGNAFPEGLSVGAPGGQQVQAVLSGTSGVLQFPSGASFEQAIADMTAEIGGVSPAQFIQLFLASAAVTAAHDRVYVVFNSAAANGSSTANLEFFYRDTGGSFHQYAYLDATGLNIQVGSIIAAHPGTTPAVPESWQTLSLRSGWSAGANNGFTDVPQVRMLADNKMLMFKGTLVTPSSGSVNNVTFATLPANYPHANFGGPYGRGIVCNLTGSNSGFVQVDSSGNISLGGGFGLSFNVALNCIVPVQ